MSVLIISIGLLTLEGGGVSPDRVYVSTRARVTLLLFPAVAPMPGRIPDTPSALREYGLNR